MLVLELKSVGKARMTSRTATSAVNHISKDAVNTPWWCAPEKQPQTTPFALCIAERRVKLKTFLSSEAASQGKFNTRARRTSIYQLPSTVGETLNCKAIDELRTQASTTEIPIPSSKIPSASPCTEEFDPRSDPPTEI